MRSILAKTCILASQTSGDQLFTTGVRMDPPVSKHTALRSWPSALFGRWSGKRNLPFPWAISIILARLGYTAWLSDTTKSIMLVYSPFKMTTHAPGAHKWGSRVVPDSVQVWDCWWAFIPTWTLPTSGNPEAACIMSNRAWPKLPCAYFASCRTLR